MDFSNELLDQVARDGGTVGFQGWYYDLVLDRLERKGFKRKISGFPTHDSGVELSLYEDESGGKVEVLTNRFSAFTFVSSVPSSKESARTG